MSGLMQEVFALLDEATAGTMRPVGSSFASSTRPSRLYEGFDREHRCADPAHLDETWDRVQADLRSGLHAVVLIDYEWGAKLQRTGLADPAAHGDAMLRVLMFRQLRSLTREQADEWLQQRDEGRAEPGPAGVTALRPDIDRATFERAIGTIHEAIRNGETYQVNYTYGSSFEAFGSPIALYRRLRERQPVPYGALIALPPSPATSFVLSCSPELFLLHEQGVLTARPMKGTARPSAGSDAAQALHQDTKNRAENLMIVDLLRNDLGRIARVGSVRVKELFAVEPYATVLQMTSTIEAEVPPNTRFPDVLRALFPCGSITGAPKHRTMQIIGALERAPRGLYTGAIGWIDASGDDTRACGDFCLSVAIRTLTLQAQRADGCYPGRFGVGAGIVLDSTA